MNINHRSNIHRIGNKLKFYKLTFLLSCIFKYIELKISPKAFKISFFLIRVFFFYLSALGGKGVPILPPPPLRCKLSDKPLHEHILREGMGEGELFIGYCAKQPAT